MDDLLRHIADELDAGLPAEPLIRNAAFGKQPNGYDIGAVDWFLGQLLFYPGPAELSADPWRDLGVVAQFTRSGIGDLAGGSASPSWLAVQKDYSQEYRKAWQDFDQQPGTRLLWATWRSNLRTMENETIASRSFTGRSVILNAGRRKFTLRA